MAVASMYGAYGTPNATALPAFQPPPGHIRSSSMLLPIEMRSSSSAVLFRPWLLDCLRAIRLNAVGMTQLVVPNTQLVELLQAVAGRDILWHSEAGLKGFWHSSGTVKAKNGRKRWKADRTTLLESAGGLVGAGRFERPTPCAQGSFRLGT
jgi:hypothetical protein